MHRTYATIKYNRNKGLILVQECDFRHRQAKKTHMGTWRLLGLHW